MFVKRGEDAGEEELAGVLLLSKMLGILLSTTSILTVVLLFLMPDFTCASSDAIIIGEDDNSDDFTTDGFAKLKLVLTLVSLFVLIWATLGGEEPSSWILLIDGEL